MASFNKLSRAGRCRLEVILRQMEIDPMDASRVCLEVSRELGYPLREDTYSYEVSNFPQGLCPDSWQSFFKEPDWVSESTYREFFKGIGYKANNSLNMKLSEFECMSDDYKVINLSWSDQLEQEFGDAKGLSQQLLDTAINRLREDNSSLERQFHLYKQSLPLKNKEYAKQKEYVHLIGSEHDVFYKISNLCSEEDPILQIELLARISDESSLHLIDDLTWGYALVNTKTGCSELLLDNRPFVWTGSEVLLGKKKIRKVSLRGDTSLTGKAIEFLIDACKKIDGQQKVSNFGGWLKDDNLSYFQIAYLNLKHSTNSLTEEEVAKAALLQTSFGKARAKIGITEFNIQVMGDTRRGMPEAVFVESAYFPGSKEFSI